jgi:homoserine kinase
LGEPVPFEKYVEEKYALNSMLRGLLYDEPDAFGKGMNIESYHQVIRSRSGLYSDYIKLKGSLIDSGALGVCISGAGPSILTLPGKETSIKTIKSVLEADIIEANVSEGIKIKNLEI